MIEVEKKFNISKEQEKELLSGAVFIVEKSFTDVYFDTADYSMTTKDTWLRKRDNNFELKIPMSTLGGERLSDQYQELDNDKEIAEFLHLPTDKPLSEVLEEKEIRSFCSITTKRRKYKKDKFIVDVDEMDFGYALCEIELMVNDISEVKDAENQIIDFAKQFNLTANYVRGKVLEYLKIHNPKHMALIEKSVRGI